MYLLYNKKLIFKILLLISIIFFIEFTIDDIWLKNLPLKIDLMFVLLTFFVFYFEREYLVIYLAFIFGLLEEFSTSVNDFGLIAFLKSFFIFLITAIKSYNKLWSAYLKNFSIFIIYLFYFFFLNIISYGHFNEILDILVLSSVETLISFIIFFIFNKILFNSKIF